MRPDANGYYDYDDREQHGHQRPAATPDPESSEPRHTVHPPTPIIHPPPIAAVPHALRDIAPPPAPPTAAQ